MCVTLFNVRGTMTAPGQQQGRVRERVPRGQDSSRNPKAQLERRLGCSNLSVCAKVRVKRGHKGNFSMGKHVCMYACNA